MYGDNTLFSSEEQPLTPEIVDKNESKKKASGNKPYFQG